MLKYYLSAALIGVLLACMVLLGAALSEPMHGMAIPGVDYTVGNQIFVEEWNLDPVLAYSGLCLGFHSKLCVLSGCRFRS